MFSFSEPPGSMSVTDLRGARAAPGARRGVAPRRAHGATLAEDLARLQPRLRHREARERRRSANEDRRQSILTIVLLILFYMKDHFV